MSEHRRPAERLAESLKLPELALFVQMRSLALEKEPERIAELEAITGVSQKDAFHYFEHFYQWGEKTKAAMDATAQPGEKKALVKALLRQTLDAPLITPTPEG